MLQPELYENKVLRDAELPVQINWNCWHSSDSVHSYTTGFASHWHEHIELHYLVEGEADFTLNQKKLHAIPGDLIIINSNELHTGVCTKDPYRSRVLIFDLADLSPELAECNYLFQSQISGDQRVDTLTGQIFQEMEQKVPAYKQACKAMVMELVVHMCRNYVAQSLDSRSSAKRKRDLERLNVVLSYIQDHYMEPVTNAQLAQMVCLSEDRFGHLFREGVGKPPLQYINEMRLKSALNLLKTSQHTVTEVAEAVGFRDYNHFGRLFRKRYGYTPYEAKTGKTVSEESAK